MMKHEISALMDGELFEDEAEILFDQIKREKIPIGIGRLTI